MSRRVFLPAWLACLMALPAAAGSMKWEKKLDSDIRFKMIHDSGLVIAGTSQTIYGFNPETGDERWRIEKVIKNYEPEAVQPAMGSPYLVFVYKSGMMDTSPDLRCLDILTGQQLWSVETAKPLPGIAQQVAAALGKQAGPEDGAYLIPSGYPTPFISFTADEERGQFLMGTGAVSTAFGPVVKSLAGEMINAKPVLFDQGAVIAYDMKTGGVRWFALVPNKTGEEKTKLTYQWSQPQIAGDRIVVDWAGLHVFSVSDGSYLAGAAFDRSNFKGANAPTAIDGNTAYVASAGQLRAVDLATGAIRWETKKDGKAVFTDIQVAGDRLVVQRGGAFEEKPGKMKVFEYGLDVLDKNTGQPLFDSVKLHKSKERQIGDMTNLLVMGDVVYYASQHSFRAFDLKALDYKYIASQAETQGSFDGVKSVTGVDGKVILLMKQTTTAFNPADGSVLWSQSVEPPKAGALAMGLLNALSAVEAQSRANRSMSGRAKYRTYSQADFYQGRTAASDQYNYVMGQEDKKPTVIGINLTSGQPDRRATMDKKEADYTVDERWGLLVNVEKKETLQVYDLNQ